MAGLAFTKEDIAFATGTVCFNLRREYEKAVVLNAEIQALTNAQWTALGVADVDRELYKTAFADLAYQKATAFDSSPAVKQLWGLGV